ncbi:MAG TPA: molybdenum cofactor guanylyltransferase [Candidatus Acidoferrum sp.]|nr:molybdenum cofactor guanylyltransferase [Candidatus Acidoferrum sp.]
MAAEAELTPIECVYHRRMEGSLDVSAFILAGGNSTRMGADKAFLEYQGRTLLARALDLARSVASDVCVVGSREKFAAFAPVVEDVFRDCGPLGGIHAALLASRTELNVMLAVDTPHISTAFLQYLIRQACEAPDAAVVVARAGGGWQPLCAVYRPEFAKVAEHALGAGRNRIDPLFGMVRTRVVEESELEHANFPTGLFRNLNTPEEWKEQERAAGG